MQETSKILAKILTKIIIKMSCQDSNQISKLRDMYQLGLFFFLANE